jgi:hypothetical protein
MVLSAFTLSSCIVSVDDEENADAVSQCTVPQDTYSFTYADAGGDCPDGLVEEITSGQSETEVETEQECTTVVYTDTGEYDGGCEYEITHSVKGTSAGLEDGEATVEYSSCPEFGGNCTHDFDVYFD